MTKVTIPILKLKPYVEPEKVVGFSRKDIEKTLTLSMVGLGKSMWAEEYLQHPVPELKLKSKSKAKS